MNAFAADIAPLKHAAVQMCLNRDDLDACFVGSSLQSVAAVTETRASGSILACSASLMTNGSW